MKDGKISVADQPALRQVWSMALPSQLPEIQGLLIRRCVADVCVQGIRNLLLQ